MNNTFRSIILSGLFFFVAGFTAISAQSRVDTVVVYSTKMDKNIKNIVILPDGYNSSSDVKYPVLYLLHGYSGRYDGWLNGIKKDLPDEATKYGMIVVCPDGQNSWYWDSPIDPKLQYETFVSKELVRFIDSNYNTIISPKGRAITGLSMGGHGGLWLGINHSDVYGACGSMSGGVDIRPFPKNWEMSKSLGNYKQNTELWNSHTVITQLKKIEPNTLAIIFDCGTSDFFFDVNQKLHEEMLYLNIEHDYIVRPGGHSSEYWTNAVEYQMLYFSNFFKKNK